MIVYSTEVQVFSKCADRSYAYFSVSDTIGKTLRLSAKVAYKAALGSHVTIAYDTDKNELLIINTEGNVYVHSDGVTGNAKLRNAMSIGRFLHAFGLTNEKNPKGAYPAFVDTDGVVHIDLNRKA